MERRYREHQGDDQKEFWPEPQPSNRFVTWIVVAICAAIVFFPFFARAEEPVSTGPVKQVSIRKAAVCETIDQLKGWLDKIAENHNKQVDTPAGCGYVAANETALVLFGGLPAIVTKVEVYETTIAHVGIVKLDFSASPFGQSLGVQYGYAAYRMKDDGV